MLNLFLRSIKDRWRFLLVCGLFASGFLIFIVAFYKSTGQTNLYQNFLATLPRELKAFAGAQDLTDAFNIDTFMAIGFLHPIWIITIGAYIIAVAVGDLAREIERGTIEMLLSYPISRTRLLITRMITMGIYLLILIFLSVLGARLGMIIINIGEESRFMPYLYLGINAFALFLTIGCYSFLFSSISNYVGRATQLSIGLTVLFFFMNYFGNIWEKVGFFKRYSIFNYFNPHDILTQGYLPLRNIRILLISSLITLLITLVAFKRRDIAVS